MAHCMLVALGRGQGHEQLVPKSVPKMFLEPLRLHSVPRWREQKTVWGQVMGTVYHEVDDCGGAQLRIASFREVN